MMEPLPYCFSIWLIAVSTLSCLSSAMVAPRLSDVYRPDTFLESGAGVYYNRAFPVRESPRGILAKRRRKSKEYFPPSFPARNPLKQAPAISPALNPRCLTSLLRSSRVLVKPPAAFLSQPASGHVFPQQRAGAVARIAEAFVEHFENVEAHVEADKVRELERPHGVVHSQLHHRIHRLGRGHSLHDREDGFVNHRHEHAVGDKARRIVDGYGLFFEAFAERQCGLERFVTGGQPADHL